MKLIEQKVLDYAVEKNMLSHGDKVVVGVSGGADSVCLLTWLSAVRGIVGLDIIGVHVHHGIRGEEADRDMQFTRELCDKLGVELIVRKYDVPSYARENRLSEEEAGRKLRYEAFREVLSERQFNRIAVAHHSEDSAETILFNMIRGSRAAGLSGILPVNGAVIRPLMCLTRAEIEQYLNECGTGWCNDSTNASEEYSRNRIRETIIPAMQMINSRAIEHILDTGEFIGELYDYLAKNVEELYTGAVQVKEDCVVISTEILKAACRLERLEVVKKAIYELAGSLKDITAVHIEAAEALIHKQSGRRLDLPCNIVVSREYSIMRMQYRKAAETEEIFEKIDIDITKAGKYELPYGEGVLCVQPVSEENAVFEEKSFNFDENICTKFMDCDKIEDILTVRTRRNGDYLLVNHGQFRKKLKEYFIDNKIPAGERDKKLLLADGSHVLWVLGYRMSDGGKLSADTTKYVEFKWIKNDTEDKDYESKY